VVEGVQPKNTRNLNYQENEAAIKESAEYSKLGRIPVDENL